MNLIETAISFEREGEAFYWEIADRTDNRGIKNICLMLARDESEHIKVFERLAEGNGAGLRVSTIVEDTRAVFRRFTNDIFDPDEELAPESLYEKAISLEKKTMDYYSECARNAKDEDEKKLYLTLAGEEKKHYGILKNILEFRLNSREWLGKRSFENPGE